MTLTDEERRALINEYNGAMDDVEEALRTHLERNRRDVEALARDAGLLLEGEAISDTLREGILRVQERLNAFRRRILEMRGGAFVTHASL